MRRLSVVNVPSSWVLNPWTPGLGVRSSWVPGLWVRGSRVPGLWIRGSWILGLWILGLWTLAVAAPVQAQSRQAIRGTLTEEGTQNPLGGAFVILLTAGGERVGATLTREDGVFLVNVPEPGRYRVRADRIGYASVESIEVEVVPGEITRADLVAPAQAIEIGGIEVEGARRCDLRPEAGRIVLGLWDEARKALDVALWTGEGASLVYDARTWTRRYDRRGRRVISERVDRRTHVGRHAFQAVAPEALAAEGFVQGNDTEGRSFYAPDAAVLLSDPFLATHCFRAVRQGERMGLMFEPVEGRVVAEVQGTLWFAPGTARLESIDFGYLNAPMVDDDRFGGEVVFEELPSGAWIVRRWEIRMPVLARETGPGGSGPLVVTGVEAAGGEVLEVREAEALLPLGEGGPGAGAIRGVAYDSISGGPLAEAMVYASGTQHSTRSGPNGEFLLTGLDPGIYTMALQHPRLEELGIVSPGRAVEVRAGAETQASVALPAPATLVRGACRRVGAEAGDGAVAAVGGSVHLRGDPAAELIVRVTWTRITGSASNLAARSTGVDIVPDAQGRWGVCRVPPEQRVVVEVVRGKARGPAVEVGHLEAGEARWVRVVAPGGESR